jgi:dihydropteroate synthase
VRIGNKDFQIEADSKGKRTYIMGILNLTPDSFYDGGRYANKDRILQRVEEMISQGMDIVDLGGESTRPGYQPISDEEEIARVMPAITAIKKEFNIPISVDTYKVKVAEAGVLAGADLINDVWGGILAPDMYRLVADSGVGYCLMHNRTDITPGDVDTIKEDLMKTTALALNAGVAADRIILDPGIGFAKTQQQNLEIINRLEEFTTLGYPLLLGASRKSVIGNALGLPVEERLEGTLVTTVLAVLKGCGFVRVHDVKEHVRAIQMTNKIMSSCYESNLTITKRQANYEVTPPYVYVT